MISLRNIATPLTAGAFLLSAVTGVLIFFHLDTGLNKPAHEWLGWALVVGACLHAYTNWPAFRKHLTVPAARGILAAFVVLLAASFIPLGGGEGGNPMRLAVEKVSNAPLTVVADLAQKDPAQLLGTLQGKGFTITSQTQSIKDIAGPDREKQMELFRAIFE